MYDSLKTVNFENKRVFLRVDYNVSITDNKINHSYKITRTLPTIIYLIEHKIKSLVIVSHLGRPTSTNLEFSLLPVYNYLVNELSTYKIDIKFCNFYDNISSEKFVFFENIRFLPEESNPKLDEITKFTEYVQKYCDIAVFDAFGTLHRECASLMHTNLPIVWGTLCMKEFQLVERLTCRTMDLLILGGNKFSTKIKFLRRCIKRTRVLFIAGALSLNFFKYNNINIGNNKVEDKSDDLVRKIYKEAYKYGTMIILPTDFVVLNDNIYSVVDNLENGILVDIGPETVKRLQVEVLNCNNIFWNGPIGMFEDENCENGTKMLAQMLAEVEKRGKFVLVGGGETAYAVEKFVKNGMDHVSTGGGSLLACIEDLECLPVMKLKREMDKKMEENRNK